VGWEAKGGAVWRAYNNCNNCAHKKTLTLFPLSVSRQWVAKNPAFGEKCGSLDIYMDIQSRNSHFSPNAGFQGSLSCTKRADGQASHALMANKYH
jgi:hypothetical protein